MKERLILYNRNNCNFWLENVKEEWWQLRTTDPVLLKFTRLIYEEDDSGIYAVDPPGGPYMFIGSKVGDSVVKEIKYTSVGVFLKLGKIKA